MYKRQQLGRTPDGSLLLLDLDDLGIGDPAWDLGRPAGFYAAGLLADSDWEAFVSGYRESGDWPDAAALDHAARCGVVIAAVRSVAVAADDAHSHDTADALLDACFRMAQ